MTGSIMDRLKVAVLMGGLSSEREISLSTGKQVLENLDPLKYDVYGVDASRMPGSVRKNDLGSSSDVAAVRQAGVQLLAGTELYGMETLMGNSKLRPDVVFIALHGRFGEDGCVQGLLEMLGLPYTGSGVLASALAMDKTMSKSIMAAAGICVPESFEVTVKSSGFDADAIVSGADRLGYPLIVKPSRQGSTIGMSRVFGEDGLLPAVQEASRYDSLILVEKFVEGTELTISVLGNDDPIALPVIEIVPSTGFYDYQAKYTPGATEEIVPARIDAEATSKVQGLAVRAHKALGCHGASRVDFIYDGRDFYALEVNTIPGMTPTSLLPRAAAASGISFTELLDNLIQFALQDVGVTI